MTRTIGIGLVGCGVVGTGILKLLEDHRETIARRLGGTLEVRTIAVRDVARPRDPVVPLDLLCPDPLKVAVDPKVDLVVEVIGGTTIASEVVHAALDAGKHVITANKALIAQQGDLLLGKAHKKGLDLYFEAAVAGGVPIIRVLREALASDEVSSLHGIVNGTSNYILSRMAVAGLAYETALLEAQEKGYAESDPTLDVRGVDAQHKLAILATLAFGVRIKPDQIVTEGIEEVTAKDVAFAARFGYAVKPMAVAKRLEDGTLDLRVHPALVPEDSVFANIHGALNAVHLDAAMVGPCLLSGPGAGALPTAMSVVSDLVDVGRNYLSGAHGRVPGHAVVPGSLGTSPDTSSADASAARFFLRLTVRDRPGVLARIAGVLAAFEVSIEQLVQEELETGEA
ncbi:MAG: homoserine dehydrogenase, partial [Myxococcota bacterium]